MTSKSCLGLPANLAPEMAGKHTDFMRLVRRHDIQMHWIEKGQHWQNFRVEREIGILKTRWQRQMQERGVPSRLWDFGLEYEAELLSCLSRGVDGRTSVRHPTYPNGLIFHFMTWYGISTQSTPQ